MHTLIRLIMPVAVAIAAMAPLPVQAGEMQPPVGRIIARCPECQGIADKLTTLRGQLYGVRRSVERLSNEARRLATDTSAAAAARREEIAKRLAELTKRESDLQAQVTAKETELQQCEATRCGQLVPPGGGTSVTYGTATPGCYDCVELVEQINTVKAEYEDLTDTVRKIENEQKTWAEAAKQAANHPQRLAAIKSQQAALDRIHAQTSKQLQEKGAQLEALETQLDGCAEKCEASRSNNEPPSSNPPKPPESPTTPEPPTREPPPPAPTTCEDCEKLKTVLEIWKQKRDQARKTYDELNDQEGLHKARHQMNQDHVRELRAKGQGGSDQAQKLQQEIDGFDDAERQRERQRGQSFNAALDYDSVIEKIQKMIDGCVKTCPTTSSVFKRPLSYVVAGGAVAGLLGVAGRNTPTPEPVAAPQPTTPPVVSTPVPPVAPAPTGRTPRGTQTLTQCQCVVDTANRDRTLRFCQAVPMLNVSVIAPGTMRVVFPAPFATLTGPFDTTTGEFRISGIGPNGESVLFGGVIDPNGHFAEAFMHFDVSSTQLTGYTFAARGQ